MDNKKNNFLIYELQILTINAAVQHNKVYHEDCSDSERGEIRKKLREILNELSKEYYSNVVSSEDHVKNINKLVEFSKLVGKDSLNNGKLTFGTCQKLFNLYLKYLWCADFIKMPPHCPFDRIILGKLGINDSWTKSDSPEDYLRWVSIADSHSGEKSLAEWELEVFNRR